MTNCVKGEHNFIKRKPIKNKKNQLVGYKEYCSNCIAVNVVKDGHECVIWNEIIDVYEKF